MEACESPKYNDKVKAAMGKRLLLGKERLVELAKICVENDHVSLRANEPTSQPPKIDSKGATVPAGAMLDGSAPIQPVASPPEPPPAILSPTAAPTALFDPTMPSSALSLPSAPALGLSGDMLRQAAEQAAASRTAVVEQAEERWAAAQEARKAKSAALAAARAEAAEQSAAAIAEAAAVEARRQAEELRKREAAAAERQATRASAIAARQADMEARNAERHAAARRHEEAAAARRHKREQAAVSAASGAAAGQSDLSGDSIDWSGATASLAIDGLLGPLRAAMAAANVRRPLHPLPFIATQLQASTGAVVSGASNDYGDASQSGTGAIDAFSYIESYESELAQAMLSCVTECEGKEGAASLRAGQATSRLAKLLDES
jgi:flagellar biosynthesis GTPase FlhF